MASESKSRRPAAAKPAAKKPVTRRRSGGLLSMDSEQTARVLLIGAVTVIILIAVGFIAFGYWYSVVRPRNRTVLQADGIRISYSAMTRRMSYELFQSIALQQQPTALPEITYQTLLQELTVINRAEPDMSVSATADEIDQKLRARVGVGVEANQKQFADALLRQLDTTGLHDDEYRRLITAELLTTKLKEKFKLQLPLDVLQAKVEVIVVNTLDDAKKAAARVQGGEDWATVAKAVSQEVDVQKTGGLHDYTPKGNLNAAYDAYVFDTNTPLGTVSAPLTASGSSQFFIVRVDDRADKPVTDDQKPKLADTKYNEWLVAQQSQMTVVRRWSPQDEASALASVRGSAGTRLLNQQRQQQQAQQTAQAIPVQQPTAAAPAPGGAAPNPPAPGAPAAPGGSAPNPPVPNAPVAPGGNGQ